MTTWLMIGVIAGFVASPFWLPTLFDVAATVATTIVIVVVLSALWVHDTAQRFYRALKRRIKS